MENSIVDLIQELGFSFTSRYFFLFKRVILCVILNFIIKIRK
jgi:hypothetical protein